ncbi:hypothetical protein CCMSSC00406_0006664 [Pleurotus cornucopiae]|uniref:Uncharacterized protein n=1 Tax=Pleurotus cornucopiae TaxID=5321 RepID=A0ACB7IRK9_PLECO|nr:hypothetical protein CCMSSC00406_0006664 [Pleurotus cornucopiae]
MARGHKYSDDLRFAILNMARYLSHETIAQYTTTSTRTVSRVLGDYRKHGTVTRPQTRLELRGAKRRLSRDDLLFIKGMISFKPDIYLDELRQALAERRGTVVSTQTLARGLARMNYTRKRITKAAAERNQLKRAAYLYEYAAFPFLFPVLGGLRASPFR